MFVRSFTVYLVKKGALDEFIYLAHGAHWAIGALAAIMFVSLKHEVPKVVTGLIGAAVIDLPPFSSVKHRRMAVIAA